MRVWRLMMGNEIAKGPKGVRAGAESTRSCWKHIHARQWWQIGSERRRAAQIVEALNEQYEVQKRTLDARFEDKVEKVRRGDDLPTRCDEDGQSLRRGEA